MKEKIYIQNVIMYEECAGTGNVDFLCCSSFNWFMRFFPLNIIAFFYLQTPSPPPQDMSQDATAEESASNKATPLLLAEDEEEPMEMNARR